MVKLQGQSCAQAIALSAKIRFQLQTVSLTLGSLSHCFF